MASIQKLMERREHDEMKAKYNDEDKRERREQYLSDYGVGEKDVLMDESGTEYFYSEYETRGDDGNEWFYSKKVVLPASLQTLHAEI